MAHHAPQAVDKRRHGHGSRRVAVSVHFVPSSGEVEQSAALW